MTAKIIDGREIADKIKRDVKKEIDELKNKHSIIPKVTTVKIGDDPSSKLYMKLRDRACEKAGIISDHVEFNADVQEEKVIDKIKELNEERQVHGILIQLPTPKHISQRNLINTLDIKKDVEGFHPYNMGKTLIGDEYIIPCTPNAVLEILKHEKINLKGKNVTIINHSMVVGKPLSVLFLNRNATVMVCHVYSKNTQKIASQADILVSATGLAKFVKEDFVKENAIVVDVGIISTDEGVCGDVDFEAVQKKASRITPVPGGVGPVTIACCLQNIVKTYKKCVKG